MKEKCVKMLSEYC